MTHFESGSLKRRLPLAGVGRAAAAVAVLAVGDVPASRRMWVWVFPQDGWALDRKTRQKGPLVALTAACLPCFFCPSPHFRLEQGPPDLDVLAPAPQNVLLHVACFVH